MEIIGGLNTDLNLGLGLGPCGVDKAAAAVVKSGGGGGGVGNKRGFSETVDLKLNLVNNSSNDDDVNEGGKNCGVTAVNEKSDHEVTAAAKEINSSKVTAVTSAADPVKPPAKAQVVGWPPVRSYRKNMLAVQKSTVEAETEKPTSGGLVKVSMDGAPYLRKVHLKMYKSYQDLSDALGKMFSSFTLGKYGEETQGMIDFMNESKLMDILNDSDYVPTYEDKDGDWMLVGDVPWEMFVESCKRLRIMKGKEAAGIAPRAMEKCKNRS